MPSVGPIAPPTHERKRKREVDDWEDGATSPSSRSPRPRSASPSSPAKESRTIGPTLPPANLDDRPQPRPDSDATSSSSDDDDFGPSKPTSTSERPQVSSYPGSMTSAAASGASSSLRTKRDEWMIIPPTSGDWTSRMDPTKLKNRKFNTGKGAKGSPQAPGRDEKSNWTETPDEKRARLQREMLGLKDFSTARGPPADEVKAQDNTKRLRKYTEESRGPSLYQEHQKTKPQEKEDDPSARAFDRDKDIAGGMKINHTQRREMMNKASDFGSRFSSGKFL